MCYNIVSLLFFFKVLANQNHCSMTLGKPQERWGESKNSTLLFFFSNNGGSRGYEHVQYALQQNTAW